MLAQQSEKSNSEIREALQKVELLSSLSVDQITKISDAVTVKNFKSGTCANHQLTLHLIRI